MDGADAQEGRRPVLGYPHGAERMKIVSRRFDLFQSRKSLNNLAGLKLFIGAPLPPDAIF